LGPDLQRRPDVHARLRGGEPGDRVVAAWHTSGRRCRPGNANRRRAEGRARSRAQTRLLGPESDENLQAAQMSTAREAFCLPLLFLTVVLLGGIRIFDRVVLLPPSLFALVLALLLL